MVDTPTKKHYNNTMVNELEKAYAEIERLKQELIFRETPADEVLEKLFGKMEENKSQVVKAQLKDNYSENGYLQIIMRSDGDIGISISKDATSTEEEQYASITLSCGPGGGSRMNPKVIDYIRAIIAELQD